MHMLSPLARSVLVCILFSGASVLQSSEAAIARIVMDGGIPTLQIGGKTVPPFAYMSYLGREPYYRDAASTGIHLYCLPMNLGGRGINAQSGIGAFNPPLWMAENAYDLGPVFNAFKVLLNADPQALVILRLYLDPPQWWENAHPEGCCQLADGTTFRECFSSPLYREATAEAMRECLRQLSGSLYAERLIGIHVAAGGTEEWMYHRGGMLNDLNPARTTAFRIWLSDAYHCDVKALRKAWGGADITFDTAEPVDLSTAPSALRWRKTDTDQPIFDTLRFHSEQIVDDIAFFCHVVKEASDGKLLTGAFYGYHFNLPDPRFGHFALSKLLRCPDLDYLSSPNDYYRVAGEDWPPMAAVDSVQLHGKLWLAENDTRTFKTTLLKDQAPDLCPPGQYASGVWLGPTTAEESVAFLRKNAARMLAGGYGGWWFDMWGGWFSEPRLLAVLRRTQELYAAQPPREIPRMKAQACVIADEEFTSWDASFGQLAAPVLANRHPLGRIGAPYEFYLRTDMAAISPQVLDGQYRWVWLLGVCNLSDAENALLQRWTDAGATVSRTYQEGTEIRRPQAVAPEVLPGKYQWTAAELRALARKAGVHIYDDEDDVLYAGRGWLGIHSAPGGVRQIHLPFPARIVDAFGSRMFPDVCQELPLTLAPCETVLLRVEPASDQDAHSAPAG